MEGIIEYTPFWLGYIAFALVGYWCWEKLFFWLRSGSDIRRFLHMLGAVILFTPAPIEAGSAYFAPAFIVLPFVALSSGLPSALYATSWLLGGLCVGLGILSVRSMIVWLRAKIAE